ncbi:phage/plasmid replication domain-containing protein [Caulobacter sp. DWR1-3-2b1]|uniref:phage/plasmid replication domain-containing protein n=1 Tax=Caulobacter sp. DWR1-3-2b1 TaxID=2804670 RepID=UPI003CF59444
MFPSRRARQSPACLGGPHDGGVGRGVCSTPHVGQSCPSQLDLSESGGFDTVRLRIPWHELPMPLGAMFVGVSADGEVSDRVVGRFSRLRLESWRGGWAIKPKRAEDGQWVILEGSPAKAATGQNLYLPQWEGLLGGVWAGLEPFLRELWCRLEARVPAEQFERLLHDALSKAVLQRLDLTTHVPTLGQEEAIALLRHVDQARGGIYCNRTVRRWNRDGETSLSCGPGRRWGAVLYCKQNEMVVVGHCPRL